MKNIAEPITVYRVLPDPSPVTKAIGLKRTRTPGWRRVASAGAFILVLFAAATALWLRPWAPSADVTVFQGSALPLPEKPSIAVLPFDNLSDDPEQEYFADGMTEDLITDLSKVSGLFVIARNSTFAYKGESPDVREVARELGVRYVLEGSVRRAGDQVRVNAQLINATTGGHLWADRYDGRLADVFALQDGITRQIVAAMEINLTTEDLADVSSKETNNPDAYSAFLLGRAHFLGGTREEVVAAIPHLEKAISLDSGYGQAYATLAWIYWKAINWELELGLSRHEIQDNFRRYLQAALKNGAPSAHRLRSEMLLWLGLYDEGLVEAEQALALDATNVDNYVGLAWALIIAGKPAGAMDLVETAMRRNPKYSADYTFTLGLAYFGMERYQQAANAFKETIEQAPEHLEALTFLAATYGHLGREQAAEAVFKQILPLNIGVPFTAVVSPSWHFKDPKDELRLEKGLGKAGIPFVTQADSNPD